MAARKQAESKSDANGFVYLSPWLPCREGWYRLAQAQHRLYRWRLYKAHEHNEASGERWVRWRLFEDFAAVETEGNAAQAWTTPAIELRAVTDRSDAGDVVEARWSAYREGKVPA